MIRLLLLVSILALAALPGPAAAVLAQQRVTSGHLEELRSKLKVKQETYYRLDQAEREALADGSAERAAVFHDAKVKALDAYDDLNAQLSKAQAQKSAQDARDAQPNPDYR